MTRPVHLYYRPPEGGIPRLGCAGFYMSGTRVSERFSEVTCRKCATNTPDLSEEQRQELWDQANERLDSFKTSPWQAQRNREERAAKQATRQSEKAARRAARDAKRAAKQAAA